MRKTIYSIMMVVTMMLASCGGKCTTTDCVATDSIADSVATEVVPQVATEVLPGTDTAGQVATEVIPDSVDL